MRRNDSVKFCSLLLKFRSKLPRLRRKYEVDESSWLVIKGRAILKWIGIKEMEHPQGPRSSVRNLLTRAYSLAHSLAVTLFRWAGTGAQVTQRWMKSHWPQFVAGARFSLRRTRLTFRWRRVPKLWEMAFIDRMKTAEYMGITFTEVLRNTLPTIMGTDGTRVLGYWTGKKSMVEPETFVREMAKLFGRSSKHVVMGVFNGLDEGKILVDNSPEEPKYQSLVDAINKADQWEAALKEMRERRTTAIVPVKAREDPQAGS